MFKSDFKKYISKKSACISITQDVVYGNESTIFYFMTLRDITLLFLDRLF